MTGPIADARHDSRLRNGRTATVALLFSGYTAYYLCRTNLAVCAPLLLAPSSGLHLTKARLGMIVGLGTLSYAVGKVVNGLRADHAGGRPVFLAGLLGSTVCVLGGAWAGTAVALGTWWILNRWFQSMGWVSAVSIVAHWFESRSHGRAMAVLSLSWLLGNAIVKWVLSALLATGAGWRAVFAWSAAGAAIVLVACSFWLRGAPHGTEPSGRSDEAGPRPHARGREAIGHVLRSPAFRSMLLVAFGLNLVAEAFNVWAPVFLVERAGMTHAGAALASSAFDVAGAASVLAAGALADRHRRYGRAALLAGGAAAGTAPLLALALVRPGAGLPAALLIGCTAACLIGPFALLSGPMSVEVGGAGARATATGLVDAAAYAGGIVSGYGLGAVAATLSWPAVFVCLATVAALTSITALLSGRYWVRPAGPGAAAPACDSP